MEALQSPLVQRQEADLTIGSLKVIDRWFDVPFDYAAPDQEKIRLFTRNAVSNKDNDDGEAGGKKPYCE